MTIDEVEGIPVSLGLLDSRDPILDANPIERFFSQAMVRLGYYVFHVQPNPAVAAWYGSGVSFIRKALGTRNGNRHIAYAVKDGQGLIVEGSQSETYVDVSLEWVVALDIVSLSKELGIQEWGLVRLSDSAEAILSEWPGPIAKQISLTDSEWSSLTQVTAKHLEQWYRAETPGLWVKK